jgi:hypothetical protein
MASTTTRLGLRKPAPSDAVDVTADLDNNWDVLDAAAGTTVCTSTSRPSAPYIGQTIRETDTGFAYVWDGTTWVLTTRPSVTICTSSTRPTNVLAGLLIYETDTNLVYVCTNTTGPVWTLYPRGCIVCTSVSRPAAPVVGTLIYETDTSDFVICISTGPTVWITLERGYIYGGKDVVHSANLTAVTATTPDTAINNMDSSALDLLPNTRYQIRVKWQATASVGTTAFATPVVFVIRIRDTNTAGTIRAQQQVVFFTTNLTMNGELTAIYETTAAESGKVWVCTAARVGASATLTFTGGGTGMRLGMEVTNLGHSGQLTQVTT